MNRKSCLLCKHPFLLLISSQVRDSKKHKVMRCLRCEHVQLYPLPTSQEDKKFYDLDKQAKNIHNCSTIAENRQKSLEDTIRRTNLISKITPKNGTILEVGSGHGFFLEAMHKLGYNITGIEISKKKRKISKKVTKVKILDLNLAEQKTRIGKFNAVTLFQVLEHIADPVKFLKNISTLVKQNGHLLVEVPNYDDHQLLMNKAYRDWFWQRAHINYFSPKTLRKVFHKAGFNVRILGVQRYSIENLFSWKLTNKPQLKNPVFCLPKEYEWIEKPYKMNLERTLKCDNIIAIGKPKSNN